MSILKTRSGGLQSAGAIWRSPFLKRRSLASLRSESGDDTPVEAPFGFDTRLVALWRSGLPNGNNGLARLVQRVAALALTVIIVSAAAALYEAKQDRESSELYGNEFAIADSAIESEFPQ